MNPISVLLAQRQAGIDAKSLKILRFAGLLWLLSLGASSVFGRPDPVLLATMAIYFYGSVGYWAWTAWSCTGLWTELRQRRVLDELKTTPTTLASMVDRVTLHLLKRALVLSLPMLSLIALGGLAEAGLEGAIGAGLFGLLLLTYATVVIAYLLQMVGAWTNGVNVAFTNYVVALLLWFGFALSLMLLGLLCVAVPWLFGLVFAVVVVLLPSSLRSLALRGLERSESVMDSLARVLRRYLVGGNSVVKGSLIDGITNPVARRYLGNLASGNVILMALSLLVAALLSLGAFAMVCAVLSGPESAPAHEAPIIAFMIPFQLLLVGVFWSLGHAVKSVLADRRSGALELVCASQVNAREFLDGVVLISLTRLAGIAVILLPALAAAQASLEPGPWPLLALLAMLCYGVGACYHAVHRTLDGRTEEYLGIFRGQFSTRAFDLSKTLRDTLVTLVVVWIATLSLKATVVLVLGASVPGAIYCRWNALRAMHEGIDMPRFCRA